MKFKRVRRVNLEINGSVALTNLSEEQITLVKKSLTFENPAYATTQRFSKYSSIGVPEYLTYYDQNKSSFTVPIGLPFTDLFKIGNITDNRVAPPVKVPPFVLELRESQIEAVNGYISSNKEPFLKGSIQMPTGKGKSILGLYLAHYYHTKTLVVVHKDDLVTGWKKDIDLAFNSKVNTGLIKAKSRVVGNFITIATIQTLNKLKEDELQELFSTFGFVIQDEMHHCPASSFSLIPKFLARYKLGLTATPERKDGLTHVMNLYFGDFCYRYKSLGAKEKDILQVDVKVRELPLYLNPVCRESYDKSGRLKYEVEDFDRPKGVLQDESLHRLKDISYNLRPRVDFHAIDDFYVRGISSFVLKDILREYKKGHSCVVFLSQKEHCRLLYEELNKVVPESNLGLYYGDNKKNDEVLNKAEKIREFITITTYSKATEGTNVKQWEVAFFVSSMNDGKNTEQAAGRIRRVKKGHKISRALIYDYRPTEVLSISSHGSTRDSRYKKLGFRFIDQQQEKSNLFSRGYSQ